VAKLYIDYLECIYLIVLEQDTVRLKTVAKEMSVSSPSALGAVNNLKKEGLVRHKKYSNIELTEKGEKTARDIFLKHAVIFRFLNEILGLDPEKADKEACQLEHHLSDGTTDRFVKFVKYLKSCPQCQEKGFETFHNYYEESLKEDIEAKKHVKTDYLSNMEVGSKGVIRKIDGTPDIRKKIISKGILPKSECVVSEVDNNSITLKFQEFFAKVSLELCNHILMEKIL